jgi:hypothetical protein
MKVAHSPDDLKPVHLTLTLKAHIVNDLKRMEKNMKQPIDEIASKALLMFIATHSDYLGKAKS